MELNEPVIRALHQRLVDELPTAAAAVNERVDDGILLPDLDTTQVLTHIPPPSERLQPPTIGIGDGPSELEDDEGFAATGRHELLIVVYEQSSDQDALAWLLRRWTSAIATVALRGRNLGDGAWGTGLIKSVPGPTLVDNPDNPQEWLSWSGIRLWAKRDEE
jgi:hypothetical protein